MKTLPKKLVNHGYELKTDLCPKCGIGHLIVRKNSKNNNYFLGCSDFPICKYLENFIIEQDNQMKFDLFDN